MKIKPEFLFDADFLCSGCGGIIGVKVSLAIVKTTGIEVTCKHCDTRFLVTEEGAIPTDDYLSGTVAGSNGDMGTVDGRDGTDGTSG